MKHNKSRHFCYEECSLLSCQVFNANIMKNMINIRIL